MNEILRTPDLRLHVKASVVLGVPLIGAHMAQMLIGIVDTIMLGWLGVEELAAGVLAFQTFFIFLIFGLGFAGAMVPLVAEALGRGEPREVRRSARMGLWVLMLLACFFMIPLWFTENMLLALGQEPNLAELAGRYMRIAQWSMIPAFVLIGLRTFLTSLEKAQSVLWFTVGTAILNAVLNYAFIFGNLGAPKLGIEGAAVATLLSNIIVAVVTIFYVIWDKESAPFEIFKRIWVPDWAAFQAIVALGLPISLTILAEAGLFSAASIMMGWLGTVPLAAHGIAIQIASMAFMVPLGLAQVASVRVGNAAGRKDWQAVTGASHAVIFMSITFGIVSAIWFFTAPEPLIKIFLDEKNGNTMEVLAYAVPLMAMAGAFQIVDGLQAVASGSLRGLMDTKVPLIIAVISYWPIGCSAAWLFAFHYGFGGVGVWGGLVVGLTAASVLMLHRFLKRRELGLTEG